MSDETDRHKERRSAEVQLGYLLGKVEGLEKSFTSHITAEEKHFEGIAKSVADINKTMNTKVTKIEDQLSMYKHFILFIKIFFAIGTAVAAWKIEPIRLAIDKFLHL